MKTLLSFINIVIFTTFAGWGCQQDPNSSSLNSQPSSVGVKTAPVANPATANCATSAKANSLKILHTVSIGSQNANVASANGVTEYDDGFDFGEVDIPCCGHESLSLTGIIHWTITPSGNAHATVTNLIGNDYWNWDGNSPPLYTGTGSFILNFESHNEHGEETLEGKIKMTNASGCSFYIILHISYPKAHYTYEVTCE